MNALFLCGLAHDEGGKILCGSFVHGTCTLFEMHDGPHALLCYPLWQILPNKIDIDMACFLNADADGLAGFTPI